jgi:hypothetical protein
VFLDIDKPNQKLYNKSILVSGKTGARQTAVKVLSPGLLCGIPGFWRIKKT